MSRWTLAAAFCLALPAAGLAPALAQVGGDVNSGVGTNSGVLQGGSINDVNGINANGTPKSQSPGSSMTVGAGNSTMIPGVAGGPSTPPLAPLATPNNGIATPTITASPPLPINGAAPPPPVIPPAPSTP